MSSLTYTDSAGVSYEILRGSRCGFYYMKGAEKRYLTHEKVMKLQRENGGQLPTCARRHKKPEMKEHAAPPPPPEAEPEGPLANGFKAFVTMYPGTTVAEWNTFGEPAQIAWLEVYLMKMAPPPASGLMALFSSNPWNYLVNEKKMDPLYGDNEKMKGFAEFVREQREKKEWQELSWDRLREYIGQWNVMDNDDKRKWVMLGDWDQTAYMMKSDPGFANYIASQDRGITLEQALDMIEKKSTQEKNLSVREGLLYYWANWENMDDEKKQEFINMPPPPPQAPPIVPIADQKGNVIAALDKDTQQVISVEPGMETDLANAIIVQKSDPLMKEVKKAPKASVVEEGELLNAMEEYQQRKLFRDTCKQQGKVWDPVTRLCVDVVVGKEEDLKNGYYRKFCPKGQILKGGKCVGIKIDAPDEALRSAIHKGKFLKSAKSRKVCDPGEILKGGKCIQWPPSIDKAVEASPVYEQAIEAANA